MPHNQMNMNVILPVHQYIVDPEALLPHILELNKRWGIQKILLTSPSKKIRIAGFPGLDVYEQIGEQLAQIIEATRPLGMDVGWWCLGTLKTGRSGYQNIVGLDGTASVISSCPLDANLTQGLSDRIATVARIAKPSTILLEDDFELSNHPGIQLGCFCPAHLQAFAKQQGRNYAREELHAIFQTNTAQSVELQKQWAQLSRQTLTDLAAAIRVAVDRVSPESRIGLCQPGCADRDGDMTASVAQALAGEHTRPLIRVYGTSYSSNDSAQELPLEMFHALYSAQHLPKHHELIHETDTYPHTRYFASAARIESQLFNACASGIPGTFLHAIQQLDDPFEEQGYLNKINEVLPRLNTMVKEIDACHRVGCEIVFRPNGCSAWAGVLGRLGMPFTSKKGTAKLLSGVTVNQLADYEIEALLSGGLFVDGQAAHLIAQRGYGDCLGVDIKPGSNPQFFYEQIRDDAGFENLKSKKIYNMLYAAAGGEKYDYYQLATLPGTQTLTEFMSPEHTPVQAGLTRCTNRLGGRVVVMAGELRNNNSSSIFSYRKKEMIRQLINWLDEGAMPAVVMNAPNVFITCNRANEKKHLIVTLTNLCADTQEQYTLHCEQPWINAQVLELSSQGAWQATAVAWDGKQCTIESSFAVMRPRVFKFVVKE